MRSCDGDASARPGNSSVMNSTTPISDDERSQIRENRGLSSAQVDHIMRISEQFGREMAAKYSHGAREHGGTLLQMLPGELLENAISEAIDQVVYLMTLREKLHARS